MVILTEIMDVLLGQLNRIHTDPAFHDNGEHISCRRKYADRCCDVQLCCSNSRTTEALATGLTKHA